MTKLTDLEAILLSAAASRENTSLLPVPTSIGDAGKRLTTTFTALIKRALAEERETSDVAAIHRTDGDLSFGVFITAACCDAIGVSGGESASSTIDIEPARQTKAARVVTLLQREEGATLAELIAETGWLPHTTRAALTGIRKRGHILGKSRRGEATCYGITGASQ